MGCGIRTKSSSPDRPGNPWFGACWAFAGNSRSLRRGTTISCTIVVGAYHDDDRPGDPVVPGRSRRMNPVASPWSSLRPDLAGGRMHRHFDEELKLLKERL